MSNRLLLLASYDRMVYRLGILRWILRGVLAVILFLALLNADGGTSRFLVGLFFIILPVGIGVDIFRAFLRAETGAEESRQKRAGTGLSYAAAKVLVRSKSNSQRLWYYLLQESGVRYLCFRLGVNAEDLAKFQVSLPNFEMWLQHAQAFADNQKSVVTPFHLFEVLQTTQELTTFWNELAISPEMRHAVWQWWERLHDEDEKRKRGFVDQIKMNGGIGRDWASGYTSALELFAFDVTRELQHVGNRITLVGHQDERKQLVTYLSQDHTHNALLVGEEGLGKQRIVYTLAVDFNRGNVPMNLKYNHVYQLDTGKIVSGANQAEIEANLHAVLAEAAHVGNVILVIPDIELLIGAHENERLGQVDASSIVSSYLQSPDLHIIGITKPNDYYTYVKPNATLDSYLLPISVKEITSTEALRVLTDEVFRFEAKTKHYFTYQAMQKIIQLAEQHIHDNPYPEKALELLDEVSGAMANEDIKLIFPKDVERVISSKLKIPIGVATIEEREVLDNLETAIRERIIGQDDAVKAVANALRRARAGLHSGKRPIGTFLFLGPTGVGKTEMAKTIAALYYKNEKAFIRIDMSEYQSPDSISKLIGAKDKPGLLTVAVTDQPFSVVLLDEIEKADQGVRNLFLQILDDGYITDGFGQRVDFTHTMVIATSNAGSQVIREAVQSNTLDNSFKQKLLDWLQSQGIFSPEWLNRFDSVVVYLPLTKDELRQVAHIQVNELINRLRGNNINLTVNENVYDTLIEKGYDPQFGARPMRRAIQDIIESVLAKSLLHDSESGTKTITLSAADLEEQKI